MRSRHFALVLAIAAPCILTACDHDGFLGRERRVEIGEPFWLHAGETVDVRHAGVELIFHRVVEDTRCPVEIECFTEGNFRIELVSLPADGPAVSDEVDWHLAPKMIADGRLLVQLLDAAPAPHAYREIPPHEYAVKLVLSSAIVPVGS